MRIIHSQDVLQDYRATYMEYKRETEGEEERGENRGEGASGERGAGDRM